MHTSIPSASAQPTGIDLAARDADIRRRRALPKGQRPTLKDLADEHHLSRERIRQIEDSPRFVGRNGRLTLRLDGDAAVILVYEGEGRYEALYSGPATHGNARVGMVIGGRRHWVFETKSDVTLRGQSLKQVAARIGEWAAAKFAVADKKEVR